MRMSSRVGVFRHILIGLLAFNLLAGCRAEPDEEALRRVLGEMEEAIESGKSGDFIERLSTDFSGQDGMDARQLRGTLLALSMRHEKLGVTLGPTTVKLFGERATVAVEVLATGGSWMPQTGQMFDIESSWKRVDGDWVCFAASWKARW